MQELNQKHKTVGTPREPPGLELSRNAIESQNHNNVVGTALECYGKMLDAGKQR